MIQAETTEKIEPKKVAKKVFFASPFHAVGFVVLIGIFAAVGIFFGLKQRNVTPSVKDGVVLSLSSDSTSVKKGEVLTVAVWVDANTESVNAVQANLSYPADKFDYLSIDSAGSAFEVEAQGSGGQGSVVIARGNVKGQAGRQLVAKVNLIAKQGSGKATVSFKKSSAITSTANAKNVLTKTIKGQYRLLGGTQ